jgi:hypothetical protein
MNQANIFDHSVSNFLGFGGGMLSFLFIVVLIYYIYFATCLFRLAKKTNTTRAWFAWLPILDFLLMTKIAQKPAWWIIFFFLPGLNIIVGILLWMGIAKAIGKPEWLGILMIITPINLIIPGYLAFSKTVTVPDKPQIQIVNVSL